jgi:hypothetical protein
MTATDPALTDRMNLARKSRGWRLFLSPFSLCPVSGTDSGCVSGTSLRAQKFRSCGLTCQYRRQSDREPRNQGCAKPSRFPL